MMGRWTRPTSEPACARGASARIRRTSGSPAPAAAAYHLFLLAGHASPALGSAGRHVSAHLHRIVDRLQGTAVTVIDVEWNVVLANPLAVALLGEDETSPGPGGNVLRRRFAGVRSRVLHQTPEEDHAFEACAVANEDWEQKTVRHPEVGDIRVDCDVLADTRSALRLVGAPGTEDRRALDLLAAIGTQDLAS